MTKNNVSKNNTLATWSLVLGILGILVIIILGNFFLPVLFGIPAVITGIISINQNKRDGSQGKASAWIGIILGLAYVVMFAMFILLAPAIGDVFNDITNAI